MLRVLGLPSLLVVLVIGGYLYAKDAKTNGPTSPTVTLAIAQANTAVAATNFQGADTAMQAFFAQSSTYAGATLPPGSGVVLVRADATSYSPPGDGGRRHGPARERPPAASPSPAPASPLVRRCARRAPNGAAGLPRGLRLSPARAARRRSRTNVPRA